MSKVRVSALFASLACASVTLAQGPPSMPAITFPVDTASVVTALVTAGATILILVFGPKIGFGLVWKLMKRIRSSI